jgi:hypothetical protein
LRRIAASTGTIKAFFFETNQSMKKKPECEETRLPMRLLVTICGLAAAAADEWSHKYKPNEDVTLWVNKVGPYHNPQETYVYYSLPFCQI